MNYGTSLNGRCERFWNVRYVMTMNRRMDNPTKMRTIWSLSTRPPSVSTSTTETPPPYPSYPGKPPTVYWILRRPAILSQWLCENSRTQASYGHAQRIYSSRSFTRKHRPGPIFAPNSDPHVRKWTHHSVGARNPPGRPFTCECTGSQTLVGSLCPDQTVITLVASAQCRARSGADMNEAFFPWRSASPMPRARAQPSQT